MSARKTTKKAAVNVADVMAEGLEDVKRTTKKLAAKPKVEKPTIDGDRLAWVLANARPAVAPCMCGCGQSTKGRFFPGCDAKLKALLKNTDSDAAREALAVFGW